ncbi:MAG: hypothetical protein PF569_00255 [Candidatus Woesearchaeota archaeon]|jgi:hypothetical protein|nr:hypothetical protein [Candidatus Woesearchaeota archaeon]
MKNDNSYYCKLLKEFDFQYNADTDAWTREDWVVRFWDNQIEVYEDVNDRVGRYLLLENKETPLRVILETIS